MGLVGIETYDLQVCIYIVLIDAMVNDISIVLAVAVEEEYYHSVCEYQ